MKRTTPPGPDPGHGRWVIWISTDDGTTWRQVGRPRARYEAIKLGRDMKRAPGYRVQLTRIGERPV